MSIFDKQNKLTKKGSELIELYKKMANEGYFRSDGQFINKTYEDFELKKFKEYLIPEFGLQNIKTILDYGGGGSNWEEKNFFENKSAKEFFGIDKVINYEPARDKLNLEVCDCVICFDVLEHIYINDLNNILNDIYSNSKKIVVLQIACYKAAALLPTGENAHITIRPPLWWKGFVDSVSINYPDISTMLFCSTSYKKAHLFKIWKNSEYDKNKEYSVELA